MERVRDEGTNFADVFANWGQTVAQFNDNIHDIVRLERQRKIEEAEEYVSDRPYWLKKGWL